ncbi:hypothetical protein LJR013_003185 [Pseudarthrobacter oxydans]|uniref:hypothetical protein n=1 Tax=Pseudarthrobacter oxydans TaxID=1671 RepID=UPI003ECECAB1
MSEQTVVALVVALIAALGGAGFWGYMANRKEAPIKKRDADVAAAHVSQQMALAVADDLRTDVTRLRADVDLERKERETLGGEVRELRAKVEAQADTIQSLRRAVRAFRDAWANLTANWHILRLQDTAPQQPYIDLQEETS